MLTRRSFMRFLCAVPVTVLFYRDATAGERQFAISVADGAVAEGPDVLRVAEGEEVVILWRSDVAGELHLHGYDLVIPLTVGETTTTRFRAAASGRFPITVHHLGGTVRQGEPAHASSGLPKRRERALLYLEVHPR